MEVKYLHCVSAVASITHRCETETGLISIFTMGGLKVIRRGSSNRYLPYARQAGRVALRVGARMANYHAARTIVGYHRRRSGGRYGTGVTNQYDRANVYRKKRMPYRKRKRWVSFVKKVKTAENSTLGTRTRVFNNQIVFEQASGPGPVKSQLFRSLALYSMEGVETWDKDLKTMLANDPNISKSGKIQMISGIFDMTAVNSSVDSSNQPMGIELDIYLCTAKRLFRYKQEDGTYVYKNIEDAMQDGQQSSNAIGSLGKIDTFDRGATPFDMTLALSSFGIKILSKKKYFLPNGNQMTYQMRDPKNRTISKDNIENTRGQNKPGVTKFLILVAKGLPGAATDGNDYKIRLDIGCTRKYAYKLNEDDEDRTGFTS